MSATWAVIAGSGPAIVTLWWLVGMTVLGSLWLATQPLFQKGRGLTGFFVRPGWTRLARRQPPPNPPGSGAPARCGLRPSSGAPSATKRSRSVTNRRDERKHPRRHRLAVVLRRLLSRALPTRPRGTDRLLRVQVRTGGRRAVFGRARPDRGEARPGRLDRATGLGRRGRRSLLTSLRTALGLGTPARFPPERSD